MAMLYYTEALFWPKNYFISKAIPTGTSSKKEFLKYVVFAVWRQSGQVPQVAGSLIMYSTSFCHRPSTTKSQAPVLKNEIQILQEPEVTVTKQRNCPTPRKDCDL
jgi:hypothetical protein